MIWILYVDDDLDFLQVGKLFLEQNDGFLVECVSSATEANRLLELNTFDVIVSDFQMPGMDGVAFLKSVRSRSDYIPFILFTGKGREEIVIEALNEGADFYLQKGNDPESQFAELSNQIRYAVKRRRTEDALRESERLFREVFNNANDAIFLLEREPAVPGVYLLVNRKAEKMLGYSMEEFLRMTPRDIIPPEVQKHVIPGVINRLNSEGYATFESVHMRKDGSTYPVEVSTHTFRYREMNVDLSIARDITDRKQAEEALWQANRQLKLMTSITRHDIINKISVILGYLEIMKKDFTDPALGTYIENLDTATKSIWSQIEFTKLYQEIGTREPQWQELEPVFPWNEVPATIALNTEVKGIEIYADLMLKNVFSNLLDNSVRHGQHVTRIDVSSLRDEEDLALMWKDNGIGIPADEKEKIFQMGFGRHTGFGLFLAKEILSLTGIGIRETGEPGEGALFEISVPAGAWRLSASG